MRVLLVADMRSPHSIGWARGLLEIGATPVVVSSRQLSASDRAALPAEIRQTIVREPSDAWSQARALVTTHPRALAAMRVAARGSSWMARGTTAQNQRSRPEGTGRLELPLELRIAHALGREIRDAAQEYRPDLIHALRIPFEGIAMTAANPTAPTAISLWGQDLALQASSKPRLAKAAANALRTIRGLHADCQRDIELACEWGAPRDALQLVAAGNMGYDSAIFHPDATPQEPRTVVFCPRGPASYVNFAGFLRVADRVTRARNDVVFMAARLEGVAVAESIRAASRHPDRIHLSGNLSQHEMAAIYQRSLIVASPSASDGTPNSVLEGMACGAVPLVGDIPPLYELLHEQLPESLFDPLDEDEMEHRVLDLLDAPHAEWRLKSETAQAIARCGWSRDVTLPRVAAWYSRLGEGG